MPTSTLIHQTVFLSMSATLIAFSPGDAVQAAAIGFDQPTIDFTNFESKGINWTLGFQFQTKRAITVNRLGFYDANQNGLIQQQAVKIFDATGNLLVAGTVDTNAPLQDWFRYTTVTPTVLAANQVFTILADKIGPDPYTWNPQGFIVDPAIAVLRNVYQTPGPAGDPVLNTDGTKVGWFGPNFDFVKPPNPVPAPPVPAIPTPALLPGLMGMGIAVWRKRQQVGE